MSWPAARASASPGLSRCRRCRSLCPVVRPGRARVDLKAIFNPRTSQPEPRLVATFHAKTLRLVLNKTQSHALAAICNSDDYTRWRGHEIVLARGTAPNGADTILINPIPDPPTRPPSSPSSTSSPPDEDEDETDPDHYDDTGACPEARRIDDNPFESKPLVPQGPVI